jgi:hypothetical protein
LTYLDGLGDVEALDLLLRELVVPVGGDPDVAQVALLGEDGGGVEHGGELTSADREESRSGQFGRSKKA